MKPEDIYSIKTVDEISASPTKSMLAYTVKQMNTSVDDYWVDVFLVSDIESQFIEKKILSGINVANLVWSSDEKYLFYLKFHAVSNLMQVWRFDLNSWVEEQVTTEPSGVSGFCLHPDQPLFCYIAPGRQQSDEITPSNMTRYGDEYITTRTLYRTDTRGFISVFNQIWLFNTNTGERTQLTHGKHDLKDPQFSQNGTEVWFLGNLENELSLVENSHLYRLPLETPDEVVRVTPPNFYVRTFSHSTGGEQVAFTAYADPTQPDVSQTKLWVYNVSSKNVDETPETDWLIGNLVLSDISPHSPWNPVWSKDDTKVSVIGTKHGCSEIIEFSLKDDTVSEVTQRRGNVTNFSPLNSNQWAYIYGDSSSPFELFIDQEHQIVHNTSHNKSFLERADWVAASVNTEFSSTTGSIDSWIIAKGKTVGKSVIVHVHGGPNLAYGNSPNFEFQLLASQGHGVLYSNPAGSQGYGEHFAASLVSRWGEQDLPQIGASLDIALDTYQFDSHLVGITGGSYGGFLTAWALSHSDRFKAGVATRGVYNTHSGFGTLIGQSPGFTSFQVGGTPWNNLDRYLASSPLVSAQSIDAPLLLIHNEKDFDVPIEQAEQLFTWLKVMNKTVAFVRIPDENHELSRSGTPSRRIIRLNHIVDWFNTYLQAERN